MGLRARTRVLGRLRKIAAETKARRSARKRARDGKTRAVGIAASRLAMARVKNDGRANPSRANVTHVPNCVCGGAFGRRNGVRKRLAENATRKNEPRLRIARDRGILIVRRHRTLTRDAAKVKRNGIIILLSTVIIYRS